MKKHLMYVLTAMFAVIVSASLLLSCGGTQNNKNMTEQLKDFIKKFEAKYIPLYKQSTLADWTSTLTGKEADYKKSADLQFEITKIFSDKNDYAILKKIKESDSIKDPILKRELTVLYDDYTGDQVDTALSRKMIDLQSKIGMKFNTFRAIVNGDTLTDNKIEDTLRNSTDSKYLEEVWKASKKSGANVSADMIALVKLRNEAAKELGYKNYHQMSLSLSEQDPDQIEKLFDQLDSLTRNEFAKLKGEVDAYYVKRYKVKKDDLMPWHYQNRFFQEAPKIYPVDVDAYYKGKDIVKIMVDYYKGIGLDVADIVKKSDLYERKGKEQHAYCTDIDKEGDVRVLGNVVSDSKWMNTMLHEFGHANYTKYTDHTLPFVLRDAAHIFTTEAIAEMFGRLATNSEWMKVMIGLKDEEAKKIADNCFKTFRLEQLVFSRWAQVMYRFEKSMYENPDQDLNKLWWDLVEKYQMLKRPVNRNEPDWASKIHIATAPCYYHNYLLGELLGSQFTYYLAKNIYKTNDIKTMSWCNKPEIGKYFIENVFKPGMRYEWNDMIEKATGEKLTAKYYAKQFCE